LIAYRFTTRTVEVFKDLTGISTEWIGLKSFKVLVADKGYDSKQQRASLRKRGIRPQIPIHSLENQEK
jgi:choline kinase